MLSNEDLKRLDFEKGNGLMPAVIQNAVSGRVLMLGYMNREALDKTINSGRVTFWSRSKNRLWTKGETSGNFLDFVDVALDCDGDSMLILANPQGPTCHLGKESCFGDLAPAHEFLARLEKILAERKTASPESSYTASLYARGTKRIAQKVGEECVENKTVPTGKYLEVTHVYASDLMYYLMGLF